LRHVFSLKVDIAYYGCGSAFWGVNKISYTYKKKKNSYALGLLELVLQLNNFFNWLQGWLPGLKTDGDASQLPTIAIVASYDTFGAAPVCYFIKFNQGNQLL
jgi:hypothetical protein